MCDTCTRVAWSGGQVTTDGQGQIEGLPFGELDTPDGPAELGDAADLLAVFAASSCDREDCPHTTAARAEAALDQPATRRELQALLARVEALEAGAQ